MKSKKKKSGRGTLRVILADPWMGAAAVATMEILDAHLRAGCEPGREDAHRTPHCAPGSRPGAGAAQRRAALGVESGAAAGI